MTYAATDLALSRRTLSRTNAITEALGSLRDRYSTYRQQRAIYQQTLFELKNYSRRDLLDLGIDPDGLDSLARRAAGW